MAVTLHPTLRSSIWVAAIPLALYSVFIGLATIPFFQRHFVYAHKISTLYFTDLNEPERWGFARNQVTPFGIQTADGESLYAWHIMPLPLYMNHEASLVSQPPGFAEDFTTTESFKLLRTDPDARLVLYFHGNAGHVAEGYRPDCYHTLTDSSSYHILTIDYRGYGHSSGTPSESGLIEDASTLVDWAMKVAGVPAERIVIMGQSLGTAVSSGVAERYASQGFEFAGIVLVSAFGDLTSMLSEYRIGGLFPVLSPFRSSSYILDILHTFIVDKWHSDHRLASIVRNTKQRLRISLVHSKNDPDIPWTEDNKLFKAAVNEVVQISDEEQFEAWKQELVVPKGDDGFVATWKSTSKDIIVYQEVFPYGGHNKVTTFAPVALAIMRSFEL